MPITYNFRTTDKAVCAHEMTKHVCKISYLNSKRLLRKLKKIVRGYFILPHPVDMYGVMINRQRGGASITVQCLFTGSINKYAEKQPLLSKLLLNFG